MYCRTRTELLLPEVPYFLASILLAANRLTAVARSTGDFVVGLAEAGLSPSSSLATLAFLVVFRVLIKLFFSMDMFGSPFA